MKMKIFAALYFCFVLAIYGSEDLLGFKLELETGEGQKADDNLKISPANGEDL